MTLTGFAVCAHTFVRINLYAQDHTLLFPLIPQIGIAMGFLLRIRMSWARALSKGCRRWSCPCAAAGVVSWQSAPVLASADCARCRGAVSWLRRLRTFLFQPVACQQVVGFCLAIWVYAGVIYSFWLRSSLQRTPPYKKTHKKAFRTSLRGHIGLLGEIMCLRSAYKSTNPVLARTIREGCFALFGELHRRYHKNLAATNFANYCAFHAKGVDVAGMMH